MTTNGAQQNAIFMARYYNDCRQSSTGTGLDQAYFHLKALSKVPLVFIPVINTIKTRLVSEKDSSGLPDLVKIIPIVLSRQRVAT